MFSMLFYYCYMLVLHNNMTMLNVHKITMVLHIT